MLFKLAFFSLIDKALADDQENIETTSTDTAISYIRENVWDPFKGKYLFNMKRQLELATQLENNLNFREKILEGNQTTWSILSFKRMHFIAARS